jgi:hypothetical protein
MIPFHTGTMTSSCRWNSFRKCRAVARVKQVALTMAQTWVGKILSRDGLQIPLQQVFSWCIYIRNIRNSAPDVIAIPMVKTRTSQPIWAHQQLHRSPWVLFIFLLFSSPRLQDPPSKYTWGSHNRDGYARAVSHRWQRSMSIWTKPARCQHRLWSSTTVLVCSPRWMSGIERRMWKLW